MIAEADVENEIAWEPTPKQAEFLLTREDEGLYGGAAGGGKSDALLIAAMGAHQNALDWSGYRAIIFRKTYPELKALADRSQELYRLVDGVYNKTEHTWRFPSGAKILFGYMDSDEDRFKHQGAEYQFIGWDELTHWATIVCYLYMFSRLRSTNPKIKCCVRATTNPGGKGHAWVMGHWRIPPDGGATRFVDEMTVGGKVIRSTRVFIPAKLSDNPYLADSGYREMLLRLPEKEKKKLLYGRWDVMEGQYFTAWDETRHVVQPFLIPSHWPRWRSLDWGSAKPYSVGWYAINPQGVIYKYRELYGDGGEANVGTRETPQQVAKRILELDAAEREQGVVFRSNPADPSIWNNDGREETISSLFTQGGVDWMKAKGGAGSRVNGWQVLNQRLVDGTFKVFSTCKHFIRTFPLLMHDKNNAEDVDSEGEDHAADETRYSIVSRHKYIDPDVPRVKPRPGTFEWLIEGEKKPKSKYRL